MKLSAKHLFATLGMLTVLAVTPTTAFADGSVHLDLPGLSIGLHDDHRSYKRHRKHYRNRYDNHRSERRRYRQNRDHRYSDRHYRSGQRYNNDRRYYSDRRYNDNYYSERRSNRRSNNNYRNDSYRVEVCPIDGYSRGYDRNRNCYEHKGHFHCS